MNYIDYFCEFFEKSKNLVIWEEPKMTHFFSIFLVILFVIVTFFPVKLIIFISLTYMFYKGRSFHAKRLVNNREVAKIEI